MGNILQLAAAGTSSGWKLASGHFENFVPWPTTAYASQTATTTEPYIVYPRPDSETDADARHRWAHDQMIYEVPIYARGGGFPYHAEIDTNNTSAALLSYITVTNNWTNTTGAPSCYVRISAAGIQTLTKDGTTSYDIYVKLFDQTGKSLKVFWSFIVENTEGSHFVFVKDDYSGGSEDGNWATPYTDINDSGTWSNVFAGTGAGTAKKIVVIRQNATETTSLTKASNWLITATAFPIAVINDPSDTVRPIIDLQATYVLFVVQSQADLFFWGLHVKNGVNPATTDGYAAFNRAFAESSSRIIWANCKLDTVTNWPATTTTNNACVTTGLTGAAKQHVAFADLEITNITGSNLTTNTGCAGMIMGCRYSLFDNWNINNFGLTNPAPQAIYFKHKLTDYTARRLRADDTCDFQSSGVFQFDFDTTTYKLVNTEICYCVSEDTVELNTIRLVTASGTSGGPVYVYRNSGNNGDIFSNMDVTLTVKGNVMSGTNGYSGAQVGQVTTTQPDYDGADVATTDFDTDNTMLDAWYTAKGETRGTIGFEIV